MTHRHRSGLTVFDTFSADHVIWRPNAGKPAGWQQGLPDVSIEHPIENIQFAAENRRVGIHIDSVREHWETQSLQFENVDLMEFYLLAKCDRIGAEVLANWDPMEQLCQEHPFAIKWGPVRPATPRMIDLHPDHPTPRWKPTQAKDFVKN